MKEDVNSDENNNKYVKEEVRPSQNCLAALKKNFFVYQKLGSFVILCGLQLSLFCFVSC